MTTFTMFQDFVVCTLRSEFDITHTEMFNFLNTLKRYIIGASAATNTMNEIFIKIRLHYFKIIVLHFDRKPCKITTEESHFHKTIFFFKRSQVTIYYIFNIFRLNYIAISCNMKLITIDAAIRTSEFR